ncbi:RNA-dependent RNA polymerase [Nephila clavipes virus 3]|uniref:RNA-dependent RNA polymerase n=1 Tax=Nephila clavipes virus 3 TaxID=2108200 RepID=UPI000D1FEBD3|nr:RNA-dependent RNA polymerase [Nephila clavipes virus 3]AVK59478.1 RNA-dependent RNA polymerase [Nephila clavipes virus 3]
MWNFLKGVAPSSAPLSDGGSTSSSVSAGDSRLRDDLIRHYYSNQPGYCYPPRDQVEIESDSIDTARAYLGAVSSHAGLDMRGLIRQYANTALQDSSSDVHKTFNEALHMVSTDEINKRKRLHEISVTDHLTIDEQIQLNQAFPQYKFNYSNVVSNCGHRLARTHRKVARRQLLDSLGYKKGVKANGFKIKDLGSSPLSHIKEGNTGIHFCCPILSQRDAQRHSTNFHQAKELIYETSKTVSLLATSYVTTMQRIHAGLNTTPTDVVCNNTAQRCPVKADKLMMLHSSYDVSPQEIAQAMDRAEAYELKGCIHFSQDILYNKEGEIAECQMRYRRIKRDNTVYLRFHFKGDFDLGYEHTIDGLLSAIFKTSVTSALSGITYHISIDQYKLGLLFFTYTRSLVTYIPKSIESKHFRTIEEVTGTPMLEITYYDWMNAGWSSDPYEHMKKMRFITPKYLYDSLYQMARNLSAGRFNVDTLVTAASSYNTRMFINGRDVMMPVRVDSTIACLTAHVVYMEAFKDKYNQGKVLETLRKQEDLIRETGQKGILSNLWQKIRNFHILDFINKGEDDVFDRAFRTDPSKIDHINKYVKYYMWIKSQLIYTGTYETKVEKGTKITEIEYYDQPVRGDYRVDTSYIYDPSAVRIEIPVYESDGKIVKQPEPPKSLKLDIESNYKIGSSGSSSVVTKTTWVTTTENFLENPKINESNNEKSIAGLSESTYVLPSIENECMQPERQKRLRNISGEQNMCLYRSLTVGMGQDDSLKSAKELSYEMARREKDPITKDTILNGDMGDDSAISSFCKHYNMSVCVHRENGVYWHFGTSTRVIHLKHTLFKDPDTDLEGGHFDLYESKITKLTQEIIDSSLRKVPAKLRRNILHNMDPYRGLKNFISNRTALTIAEMVDEGPGEALIIDPEDDSIASTMRYLGYKTTVISNSDNITDIKYNIKDLDVKKKYDIILDVSRADKTKQLMSNLSLYSQFKREEGQYVILSGLTESDYQLIKNLFATNHLEVSLPKSQKLSTIKLWLKVGHTKEQQNLNKLTNQINDRLETFHNLRDEPQSIDHSIFERYIRTKLQHQEDQSQTSSHKLKAENTSHLEPAKAYEEVQKLNERRLQTGLSEIDSVYIKTSPTNNRVINQSITEYREYLERSVSDRIKQLQDLSELYITNKSYQSSDLEVNLHVSPENVGLIERTPDSIRFLVHPKIQKKNYIYCFDCSTKEIKLTDDLKVGRKALINDFTEALVDSRALENIKTVPFERHNFNKVTFTFIRGVPGCGKTYYLVTNFDLLNHDLILASTRSGRDELRHKVTERYKQANNGEISTAYRKQINEKIKTYAAILLGKTSRGRKVFMDEALMQAPGLIFTITAMVGAEEVIVVGDDQQIGFVPRLASFAPIYTNLAQVIPITKHINISRRCPADVAAYWSYLYDSPGKPKGFVTISKVRRSMRLVRIHNLNDIPRDSTAVYLTFLQRDKMELKTFLGVKDDNCDGICLGVHTVHEYQGGQADNVILVRLNDKNTEQIFNNEQYVLVATTRHKKSLIYATRYEKDLVSNVVSAPLSEAKIHPHIVELEGGGYFKPHWLRVPGIPLKEPKDESRSIMNLMEKMDNLVIRTVYGSEEKYLLGRVLHYDQSTNVIVDYNCRRNDRSSIGSLVDAIENESKSKDLMIHIPRSQTKNLYEDSLLNKVKLELNRRGRRLILCSKFKSHSFMDDRNVYEAVTSLMEINLMVEYPNDIYEEEPVEKEMLLPRTYFTDGNIAGAETLQDYHDRILPGNSAHFDQNDVMQANLGDISFDCEKMRMDSHGALYKMDEYDQIQPKIKTMAPKVRPNTKKEMILGIIKRNLNIPDNQGNVYERKVATDCIEAFKEVLDHSLLKEYQENPIKVTHREVAEWLYNQPSDITNAIGMDMPLWQQSNNTYHMSIKRVPKPDLTTNAPYEYASLQTIVFHPKNLNAIWCPLFREVKSRIMKALQPNIILFSDMSPKDLGDRLSDLNIPPEMFASFGEGDIGKYDKSQALIAAYIDYFVLLLVGVPEPLALMWFEAHINPKLKDFLNKIVLMVAFQRKSGDASTFILNTILVICLLLYLFKKYNAWIRKHKLNSLSVGNKREILIRECILLASGDDTALIGSKLPKEFAEWARIIFNFEMKVFDYQSKYFCSKFVVQDQRDNSIKFIPDPLKLLVKLGRSDLRNPEHIEQFRISLEDLTLEYNDLHIIEEVERAIEDRYSCPGQAQGILYALSSVIHNKDAFHSLYYIDPNGNYLYDPSIIDY